MSHYKSMPWGTQKQQQNSVQMEEKSSQQSNNQTWAKQTNHIFTGNSEVSKVGSNSAAIENKKRKDELSQKVASEKSAAKIKNDYIKSIKNGVLSGSIKYVTPASGTSSSTDKSASDY